MNDAVIIQSAGAGCVLVRGNAEEHEGAQPQVNGRADLVHEAVDAELIVAGHGRNFIPDAAARTNEERQNEVVDIERGFAHQVADQWMLAQPAWADDGETGIMIHGKNSVAAQVC